MKNITSVRAHLWKGKPVRQHYRVNHVAWDSGFTTLGTNLSRKQALELARKGSKQLSGLITVYDGEKAHSNIVKQYYKQPKQ